ncbi:MAG: ABC transporter ATP-binding protein [Propionibacteriaceae bacterium]|nr:ABC transporter ATP-binding protein [Propionibacteriaceae bacterium]
MPKVDFSDDAVVPSRPTTPAPATPTPAATTPAAPSPRFRSLPESKTAEDDFLTAARTSADRAPARTPRGAAAPAELLRTDDDVEESPFTGWMGDSAVDESKPKPSVPRPAPRQAPPVTLQPEPVFEPQVDFLPPEVGPKPRVKGPAPRPTADIAPDLASEPIPAPRRPRSATRPQRDPVELSKTAEPIIDAQGLSKAYGRGDAKVEALRGVDVTFGRGTFTVIMGPSGSGKSTLLHLLAGLDRPTSGTVTLDGKEISKLKDRDLTKVRRASVGFVFQAFNLLPTLTAEENILLPLRISKKKVSGSWVEKVIEDLNLDERLHHKPAQLSGGQQQRIAVARALVTKPAALFADEPTGNLDVDSARDVLTFLREAVDEMHQAVLMVTHDPFAASFGDRVLFLEDGRFVNELANPTMTSVMDTLRDLSQGV